MNPPGSNFKIRQLVALFDWIVSEGETPFMTVMTGYPGAIIPDQYANESGMLTLDISRKMVSGLTFNIETSTVSLMATFDGVAKLIRVPAHAVTSLYANESKRGESFTVNLPCAPSSLRKQPLLMLVHN